MRQFPPEGLDRDVHRAGDVAMSEFPPRSYTEQLNRRAAREPFVQFSCGYLRDLPERRPPWGHHQSLLPPYASWVAGCVRLDGWLDRSDPARRSAAGSMESEPNVAITRQRSYSPFQGRVLRVVLPSSLLG